MAGSWDSSSATNLTRDTSANDKPLPLHAVISVEPGIYLPGRFGVRIEDVVVLEEDGCRNLMELGKDLEHL